MSDTPNANAMAGTAAVAENLGGGARVVPTTNQTPPEGILSLRDGREASPELYRDEVDRLVTSIGRDVTPFDQVSRKVGRAIQTNSLELGFYSVGVSEITGTTVNAVAASATGDRFTLEASDNDILDIRDTVAFLGVDSLSPDGTPNPGVEFVALVLSIDGSGNRVFQPINGGEGGGYPAIPAGTEFVRLGNASAELDVLAAVSSYVPTKKVQYCQKFMLQVEESTFAKLSAQEADWGLKDLERKGIEDLRLKMEGSFLFGRKSMLIRATEDRGMVYTTGGIYHQIEQKMEIGAFDPTLGFTVIIDDNLSDILMELNTGVGSGSRTKVGFMGRKMLSAFEKIRSNTGKTFERPKVDKWDLTFTEFSSTFGSIMAIYTPALDYYLKEDEAIVVDPSLITKHTFMAWAREEYDMKALAKRDSRAVVFSEVSGMYLRNPKAHAILKLAPAP